MKQNKIEKFILFNLYFYSLRWDQDTYIVYKQSKKDEKTTMKDQYIY